jgi:3-methyladenine DNA glycosylase/8-oxoguanine DNA glycosylase
VPDRLERPGGLERPDRLERSVRLKGPFDLRGSFRAVCRGGRDPTNRFDGDTYWRATATPEGPATLAVRADPANGELRGWAWGSGASAVLDGLPDLVGASDDLAGFATVVASAVGPGADVVAGWARRRPGLRIPHTGAVVEALIPSVLEQKVAGREARRSYQELVVALGEPAPGPAGEWGMRVPPAPAVLAATPSWAMHPFGIERRRAETLSRVGAAARHLERVRDREQLTVIPGVGPWTAAEVALVALGDADAVSVGDFHLPHQLAWALIGEARGDDDLMLELLEPWKGHRGRVLRLVDAVGVMAPRFGPRQALRSFRDF